MNWIELNWTELNWIELNWIKLNKMNHLWVVWVVAMFARRRTLSGRKSTESEPCRQYGTVEDSSLPGQPVTICGSNFRISHLYMSVGHEVKIWVTAGLAPRDLHRFVIHYRSKWTRRQLMLFAWILAIHVVAMSLVGWSLVGLSRGCYAAKWLDESSWRLLQGLASFNATRCKL